MSISANQDHYANAASNASFTGPWIPMNAVDAIAFQVLVAGTGNPSGTWGVDVTDDEDPTKPFLGTTALAATAEMTAAAPAGAGVAINKLLTFNPAPRVKWMRLNLTISGGGSATVGSLKIGLNRKGVV